MEKKSKKSVIIGITILFLVTLILLGLTYAYYRTRIVGNNEEKSISVTSKKLEVTYSDDKAVIEAEGIEPGYTATKTFSVENTGSEPTNFGIVLDNVENTFTRKSDWTFVLKQGEIVIREGVLPSQTSYIANTLSIEPDETIEYTLTINYANLKDVNQSEDMGNILSLRINIDNETGTILESAADGTLLAAIRDDNLISEPLTVSGKQRSSKVYERTINQTLTEEEQNYYIVYGPITSGTEHEGFDIEAETAKYSEIYSDLDNNVIATNNGKVVLFKNQPTDEEIEKVSTGIYEISLIATDPAPTISSFTLDISYPFGRDSYEAELSATEDDYGTSYYYRGTVDNNYVNFSGMCWRVVRVQGNGIIKLILADDERLCNDKNFVVNSQKNGTINNNTKYAYNSASSNDVTMLDYTQSDVSKILNAWLNGGTTTLNNTTTNVTFEKKIDTTKLVTTEWCNDLAQSSYSDASMMISINFDAYTRIGNNTKTKNINTTLKCDFTGINNTEAQKINSNIGILSADEVLFSGLPTSYNLYDSGESDIWKNYLVEDGDWFWTMTPYNYISDNGSIKMIMNFAVGDIDMIYQGVDGGHSIRPVIALPASTAITSGNGTQMLPYIIE